ncbi:MAG: glycosyltransferase family 2 protein, partial [Chloroflexota bacterium]
VIIPNWNGGKFLPTCLDALNRQTYPNLEVIVADNASTDGSQALIASQYSQVKLVQLPENRGFTGACNAGIRAAAGDYIALLNNDTEVDSGWAAAVVDALNATSKSALLPVRCCSLTSATISIRRVIILRLMAEPVIAVCGSKIPDNLTKKNMSLALVVVHPFTARRCSIKLAYWMTTFSFP